MADNEATTSRSPLTPVTRYLRETRAELAKVTWPTREEWLRLSGIVLVVTAIMAVILGVADAIGSQLIELLLRL
ncbi:MAG: preprotein translocase subunit SecE [Anaerolineae bacterium]|nr:preprotein translocase subunit SecE [Caldilineales bacterium]MCX7851169.1 preprotein translocase subunit SecE [Caldilineales bacterium]MDW8268895.1 preprotein translocase subunit SecE [Anaerolineae bacterium]